MRKHLIGSLVSAAALALLAPIVAVCQPPAGAPPAAGRGGRAPREILPTPRLPDGHVDFGGKGVWAPKWVLDWASRAYVEKAVEVPFTPEGLALYKERQANHSKDDPEGYCLPAGVPRYTGTPYPFQIIQLPDRVVILYEGASHMYRVILMDAKHSKDPDPSWLGESVGSWEDKDTLVVDSIAFNGKTWLDYVGHPASESLHVIERFKRPDLNTLWYETTIEDPKNYTKPWTVSFKIPFQAGWEIKEYVCLENNKDLLHMGTTEPK